MTCFYPIYLKDSNMYVPCGKCKACRLVYVQNLVERGKHQAMMSDCSLFVTFTYSDENLPSDYQLHYDEFQRFLKRFRKKTNIKGLKYLVAGEYGGTTGRPHFHAIFFGLDKSYTLALRAAWSLGHITVDIATPGAVGYIAKYALKTKKEVNSDLAKYGVDVTPPMVKWSKGLGSSWVEKNRASLSSRLSYTHNGSVRPLNRYYWSLINYSRDTKADYNHPLRNYLRSSRRILISEAVEKMIEETPECKGNAMVCSLIRSRNNASKILNISQKNG